MKREAFEKTGAVNSFLPANGTKSTPSRFPLTLAKAATKALQEKGSIRQGKPSQTT